MNSVIIFTDMDGTLLDHHNYSFKPAVNVLQRLDTLGIPVIPTTSKTFAELKVLRESLNNHHPFIVENGAAVCIPSDYVKTLCNTTSHVPDYQALGMYEYEGFWVKPFAKPRKHWQGLIGYVKDKFPDCFITYQEAGIDGIMAMTGLSRAEAEQSSKRLFGEPIKWVGSAKAQETFIESMESLGAHVLKGGRFLHVSDYCDKGKALLWLKTFYHSVWQKQEGALTTIGLGDSHNDIAMLEAVEKAIIVRSPIHEPPSVNGNPTTTAEFGPSGWAQAIGEYLDENGYV
ncbi:HAD-IIB family hydrolase [Marinibactrum halimedae]|uniref:Mannosyl-3-phosphoglycerate phosphatase n=1 Tax=Marinibactrum halimedae TaxID=1444977 RepID=A0AA37T3A5_9GAMM|nr:HAD-IIB family hydrolase [Marinibactrum halimedae]MCD9458654.1 HAD-IIB family hydrolase [Marinibactrum halimedae]GLS25980.1 mannosyl-3-phosphoglycerate phosphatase [Marinibactrum halimedae]